jgi:hypothetical protein
LLYLQYWNMLKVKAGHLMPYKKGPEFWGLSISLKIGIGYGNTVNAVTPGSVHSKSCLS